jgi:site-specific DNA-methyltransferase (adenine-specific)
VSERVTIGNCTLYRGDCLGMLHVIPVAAAIVSDPPYGIAKTQGGGRKGGLSARRNDPRVIGDDVPFDPSPWFAYRDALLWGANHYANCLPPSGGWLVWDKKLGVKVDCFSDGEVAWHREGRRLRIYRKLWNGLLAHEKGERRHHISQKPIDLMSWCLAFVEPGPICDPYLGSGTTAIAAMRAGLPFVGIEIDPAHFATACRRIETAHRQGDMLAEVAA